MHLDIGIVEVRGGRRPFGPGGSFGLLGESRVATNIRGFFTQRIALPDTGEYRLQINPDLIFDVNQFKSHKTIFCPN